jgi:hypothetical protein
LAAVSVLAAVSAQNKYTLKLPNGIAFSEFRGYENWQVVSVSQTTELLKVEVANPAMIDAYRAGIPGSGKPFPEGSKIAKIEWKLKKMAESPFAVNVPDTLQDVFLIEKDSKRFPDTRMGTPCLTIGQRPIPSPTRPARNAVSYRTIVKDKDYIFHHVPETVNEASWKGCT